jgi:hypothetical protein
MTQHQNDARNDNVGLGHGLGAGLLAMLAAFARQCDDVARVGRHYADDVGRTAFSQADDFGRITFGSADDVLRTSDELMPSSTPRNVSRADHFGDELVPHFDVVADDRVHAVRPLVQESVEFTIDVLTTPDNDMEE